MNQVAIPSGGWLKYASFGGKVVERSDGACPECTLFKTANIVRPRCEHHFVERTAFGLKLAEAPQKYAALLDDYKKAINVQRVAPLNPEFSFYRVMALHGDFPNTNGDLFRWGSKEDPNEPELLRLIREGSFEGKYVFQTFSGKGNYKDHNNSKVVDAVGIILDAVPNHKVKGIEILVAVDRTKDPMLVRGIDSGYITDVSMGAVLPGTKILLSSGDSVSVELVPPGLEVMTHKGRTRRIKAVQRSYIEGHVVKVRVEGGQELLLTGDHPIWSISSKYQYERTLWRSRMAHQRRNVRRAESGWVQREGGP